MDNEGRIEAVPARALGMIVCDACWRDPATGKSFLLGLFSDIRARSFPFTWPVITIYVALTGVHGKTPVRIRLVRVAEEDVVLTEMEAEIASDDPRMVVELPLMLVNVVFEQPGEYRFQLWSGKGMNASCLLERRIVVHESKEQRS
jgi:hypothetical protein